MSFTICASCAKPIKLITPVDEEVLVVREDKCTGPEELKDYVLIGKKSFNDLADFLNYCLAEQLVPVPETTHIRMRLVPENLTCPAVPDVTLRNEMGLVAKDDLAGMFNLAKTCAANDETRRSTKKLLKSAFK